ncbi:MAG: family 1 glycosylhydrolase [Maricaulaceae bacterium]
MPDSIRTAAFPDGFAWGAGLSGYLAEGGNVASDWWVLEHCTPAFPSAPSGDACDHHHRYESDFTLAQALGLNAFRISLEWSRIEPEPGKFSQAALDHYARVLEACRRYGMTPLVVLHHNSTPRWAVARGGWESLELPNWFARYAETAAGALGDLAEVIFTLYGPNAPVLTRSADGAPAWSGPGFERHRQAAERALGAPITGVAWFTPAQTLAATAARAHDLARQAVRAAAAHTPVGFILSACEEDAEPGAEAALELRYAWAYDPYYAMAQGDDVLGIHAGSRWVTRVDGRTAVKPGATLTAAGDEYRPEALERIVRNAHRQTQLPIWVADAAYAGENDRRRSFYLDAAVRGLARSIDDGVPVRGFCYGAFLDQYDWFGGFRPRSGLIDVDRPSQARRLKPSAVFYAGVARDNGLTRPPLTHDWSGESAPVGAVAKTAKKQFGVADRRVKS